MVYSIWDCSQRLFSLIYQALFGSIDWLDLPWKTSNSSFSCLISFLLWSRERCQVYIHFLEYQQQNCSWRWIASQIEHFSMLKLTINFQVSWSSWETSYRLRLSCSFSFSSSIFTWLYRLLEDSSCLFAVDFRWRRLTLRSPVGKWRFPQRQLNGLWVRLTSCAHCGVWSISKIACRRDWQHFWYSNSDMNSISVLSSCCPSSLLSRWLLSWTLMGQSQASSHLGCTLGRWGTRSG